MVDAIDSKSITRKGVEVRVLSSAQMKKLIVICGPTATGKSDYAVTLAKEINGEVISADSRQVYKGLDIGSGKITQKEMRGVPHYLLDVANAKRVFSVARYKKMADKAIATILKKGKVPIMVGGTGFYIDAVVFDQQLPAVKADPSLRKKLEKKSLSELQTQLQTLDPERFADIDTKNKVRLIRAIEIATALGKVPRVQKFAQYDVQWIYLDFPDEVLKQRIHDRLVKRMRKGMVQEVRRLHEEGVAWSRLEALGLEYRFIALYLQKKLSMASMLTLLETAIWQYAKRQRTWFKKYAK
jgi:tRNA dimethylallyltransferase